METEIKVIKKKGEYTIITVKEECELNENEGDDEDEKI